MIGASQGLEGVAGDEGGDIGGNRAAGIRLVDDDEPAGLADRREDRFGVKR